MPEIKILGDSPTTEDGLGFAPYVDILLEAINNFDAESPLTIGIHGSWGSGKTSLMSMLEKRFEKDNSVKTIWFNAWAHGREEPIGLALLQQMLIALQKEEKTKKIRDLIENVGKLLTDAALRKTIGMRFKDAKKHFKNSIEVKSTLRNDFETAIGECLPDKRLVVFIDDLDRCLPEKTIEILEAIKLFLDVPRCVFVIGVEEKVIERGIEVRYKSREQGIPISGEDYIEKIIQVPFRLPPIREEDMTKFIESMGISEEEKGYVKMAKGIGWNLRKVKRVLNMLRIRLAIAGRHGINPKLFTKLFVIEHTFPNFYKDVLKYREQDLLGKLERLANGKANEDLREALEGSETMQNYHKNEDLRNLLKDEPFFGGINIDWYVYLSEIKPPKPKEVLVFNEPILDELLSGDIVKMWHATSAIKKMPDLDKHQYQDIVTSKLKEKNAEILVNAVMALRGIGDAKAVEPLIKALEDGNESVRVNAADALGWIGNAKAVGPLINALKDDTINVRLQAAPALGRIGDTKAVEPLIAALKGENESVRVNVANALGWIGDVKAIESLIEVLKDENEDVRRSAAWALGEIGDIKAVEPLIDALTDEIPNVRGAVAHALGEIGDHRAIEPLKGILAWEGEGVLDVCVKAIEKIEAKQQARNAKKAK